MNAWALRSVAIAGRFGFEVQLQGAPLPSDQLGALPMRAQPPEGRNWPALLRSFPICPDSELAPNAGNAAGTVSSSGDSV